MLSDMTTIFCSQHRANMQYILIWKIIYNCVGGYSVLTFWGRDIFLAVGWGGALANKIRSGLKKDQKAKKVNSSNKNI